MDKEQAVSFGGIRIGLGETVITPRDNVLMHGFARSQMATGVHDELHARTLIVQDDRGGAVAIMSLSLVIIERYLALRIREGVTAATGIPPENILISCTHTHSGPHVEKASESYRDFLVEAAVNSAADAWNTRFRGRIGIGSTMLLELGRNRRRLLYGGIHPDPELAVMKIEDDTGMLRGVMFNFGCHPSTLDWQNTYYSEDWPYYAIAGIKKELGAALWTTFLQSAQGDINTGYSSELSAVGADMPVRNYWYIEIKGNQMSDAVLAALPAIETTDDLTVDAASDVFAFPLRESFPITLEEAEKNAADADERLARYIGDPEYAGTRKLDQIRFNHFSSHQRLEFAKIFYSGSFPKTAEIEMQAIRIGDSVFFSLPGEIFSEIALSVKKRSPFAKTFGAGVANGYYGYMPTAKEFIEGDYEVDGSRYSPKTEAVCIESALEVIGRLKNK